MARLRVSFGLSATVAIGLLAACAGGPGTSTATSGPGEGGFPPAEVLNDEGGPVTVTGEVAYTYPFFTSGVAQPLIVLEDQGGFVERDRNFLFPPQSQVLGKITSDFYTSPFSYSLTLPDEPQGSLRDVDQDGGADHGVMVFAVAYWTNIFGDPYLEKRDQYGGGWSSAYASTQVSDDRENYLEVYGGTYLVYAPEAGQGFPAGFGDDGRLFTEDDPIVGLPQGWTRVDLDSDPFTFDRSREPEIELFEPESLALDDFSGMSYGEAFDAMLEKFRTEYAFTELKDLDWDALAEEFRPRFEAADQAGDSRAYFLALRDFLWSVPDGHVGMDLSSLNDLFQSETGGGLGLALRELDGGRVIASFVTEGGPAALAGLTLGTEVLELDGVPIADAVAQNVPWSSPFSTEHTRRLQQLRYVVRFPLGTEVELAFRDPDGEPTTASLTAVPEDESFTSTSFFAGLTGHELPVEFRELDSGFGYARLTDFFDNELLTIQLWERMIGDLNENQIPGLVLDLRQNGGGSGYLAEQMAAYFFDEDTVTGNTAFYDDSTGEFYLDTTDEGMMFPPPESQRYHGPVAVLVGPACASACEFFSYAMTLKGRAIIVGQYPTAGLGGSVSDFVMPEGISVRFTIGRAVSPDGEIHIEGQGVAPEVVVPVTEETVLAGDRDPVLEAAIEALNTPRGAGVVPQGPPAMSTPAEALAALQAGNAPFLQDLAREDHGNVFAPGEYVFTVPLGKSQDTIWHFFWCTADVESFEDNWGRLDLTFILGGENIPLERFAEWEGNSGGQECRLMYTLLRDWPIGEHVLVVEVDFPTALNDGFADYEAGVRRLEYHVYLDR